MSAHDEFQQKVEHTLESFHRELSSIRTGRATVSILDPVQVSCYGAMMPLNQVATLRVGDATCLIVEPFDKSNIAAIEKGIVSANIGLTPNVDGLILRINLPQLTEDKRKEFSKQVTQKAETARATVRNLRIKAKETLKEEAESEDDEFQLEKHLQEAVDVAMKKIDEIKDKKIHDIMSI